MVVQIGKKAPNLKVANWVQGLPTNIDKEKDKVVLVEVFQVNCPGCFLYGIPEAVEIYRKYRGDGVRVLGLATAFEDYDLNTLENLKLLLTTGQVVGETYKALGQYGQLDGNKLPYKILFPVGMDSLKKKTEPITEKKVETFVESHFADFKTYSGKERQILLARVADYLRGKEYTAETFEEYALQGTPSSILIDRKGVLRQVTFGQSGSLDAAVRQLVAE